MYRPWHGWQARAAFSSGIVMTTDQGEAAAMMLQVRDACCVSEAAAMKLQVATPCVRVPPRAVLLRVSCPDCSRALVRTSHVCSMCYMCVVCSV
jgi:hypothetical protein